MNFSQDYEESSEDEPDEIQRPFYIPRYRNNNDRIKKPDIDKHTVKYYPMTMKSSKKRPSTRIVYEVVNSDKKRTTSESFHTPYKADSHQEYLFEYGVPINGYKILTTFNGVQHPQGKSYLEKYWTLKNSKLLPVHPGNQLDRDNVYFFYQKSCDLLKQDMKTIVKRERIRWHPDRMHLREATKIFQIINDLWESMQQS